MKRAFFLFLSACAAISAIATEPGVPLRLATERALQLKDITYRLSFRVPESPQAPVTGEAEITFTRDGNEDLTLDFCGKDVASVAIVNGRKRSVKWQTEHILIPARWLKRGENSIRLSFTAADKSLNRNGEYLYTLFVPANARSVFPCFDQPDLKARFTLNLHLPEGWTSISSADPDHPIPTYLFSFTAGRFSERTAERNGRTLRALYRETDPQKTAQLDKVFDEVALAIRWMEQYTGISYPFANYAFAILPGYQFGGMEHPGAIQYTDREIFLGPQATPDEEQTRFQLIAHETAHMWFGDLVTMRWFNDVWTKEVFANFFADKISREQFPAINHDLNFLKAYQTKALIPDRTDGTHAIQQPLDNLKNAGLLYGNIIYYKAPVMMRKLEQQMGADAFRRGVQKYLRQFAYGNATWDELISILHKEAPRDSLKAFSETWVKQKGLPTITTSYERGHIVIRQRDPFGRGLTWKQKFKVGLFYSDQEPIQEIEVNMQTAEVRLPVEREPYALLPNYDGSGYGRFPTDAKTLKMLGRTWQFMKDDLHKYAALMTLYENYEMQNVKPGELLSLLNTWLFNEANELIASSVCTYIGAIYLDLDVQSRHMAEHFMLNAATKHPLKSVKRQMLQLLGSIATSKNVVDELYGIWLRQDNELLTDHDYTSLAWHLAIVRPEQWQEIINAQRSRLKNADDLREFDFVSQACTPHQDAQRELFKSLLKKENRSVEPWARKMLALLCCNERETISNSYITPGLDALHEIQQTSDIFFPGYWLGALLGQHRSQEAKDHVQRFIETHPGYPETLMNKLKQSASKLLR